MTWVANDPATFVDEMIDGLALAAGRWVRRVPGGVVRADGPPSPCVAVVIGGGSGHFPAFGGLVGTGMAHGAALGNVFASPSADQVEAVARAAHAGRGVLFSYGNYAGDVMHFDTAQRRLREAGVDCRTVVVTDDIASAPEPDRATRRGIAGGLVVYKVAGAAADAGLDLDAVQAIASRANDRTRSLGVAFGGCSLPGASEPMFRVPAGHMAIGMGVHGEPGLGDEPVTDARGLADTLLDRLLAEAPDEARAGRGRVAVILNGLGSVKYEELYVVYRRVAERLALEGLEAVDPEVGELVTSFDMPGLSLTLAWLDEELEAYWRAPADSVGFRRVGPLPGGGRAATGPRPATAPIGSLVPRPEPSPRPSAQPARPRRATGSSRACAARLVTLFAAISESMDANADELGRIDATAGDGDHGMCMRRGAAAAAEASRDAVGADAGVGTVLGRAGDAWAARAGGASGALWGAGLAAMAEVVGDTRQLDTATLASALAAALRAVETLGGARVGEKTLLDVLAPVSEAVADEAAVGASLTRALEVAATVAADAASATASLVPRAGRARIHAERARGVPDAGAVSLSLVLAAVVAWMASGVSEGRS